eukprot:jgi/Chlat1/5231/Chrsp33S05080
MAAAGVPAVQAIATEPPKTTVAPPTGISKKDVEKSVDYHMKHTPVSVFYPKNAYAVVAKSVKERLVERFNETYELFLKEDPKMCYYISMEFLQGRTLLNAIGNLGLRGEYAEVLKKYGQDIEDVASRERDAALGNGGLGRLASCFLDSIATTNLPGWGYGMRYKYGLFRQTIAEDGTQEEHAEDWLEYGNPWEIPRPDIAYPIRYYGSVTKSKGQVTWEGGEELFAVAYDNPIPGYGTKNTINLRLWNAHAPPSLFNLEQFNSGHHTKAAGAQIEAEKINSVLYPGDGTTEGKALRLKQQYMLVSASLQDIMARFKVLREKRGLPVNWEELPTKAIVQMNDTHPSLVVPELMRLLMDEQGLSFDKAWGITCKACAYTNHTVLPEALEKWPLKLMKKLLPRHTHIIAEIDDRFVDFLEEKYKDLPPKELSKKKESMRILGNLTPQGRIMAVAMVEDDGPPPEVRMANMSVIAGVAVNGVAAIHTEIVKSDVFKDFYELFPEKFQNKTNGVTPRRWLKFCNPSLSAVITKWLGTDEWVTDLDLLQGLRQFADDKELHKEWNASKFENKANLAQYIKDTCGVELPPAALFDIQVKRIHEYKRQLLNILGVVYRYKKIKEMTPEQRKSVVPRAVMIGGKAFATYWQAKRIVKFVSMVGHVVNNDPEIEDLLKVVFVPDYNVTLAERLIPASELSQHISTAGMEASGTSNMKFAMNGCLIIGTLDGANVEIRDEVGHENFFLFGVRAEDVARLREERAEGKYTPHPKFTETLDYIRTGVFGSKKSEREEVEQLLGSLEGNSGYGRGDYFLVGVDFAGYIEAQEAVDAAYKDRDGWARQSIMSTAGSGFFSSDRTIRQYAKEIWGLKPLPVP